ncbi:MAG: Spi family protease inhibitor [Muribaculaceae bacterium]|nr:Spi family protease inhibitor [Muribaculaceae bacterium]
MKKILILLIYICVSQCVWKTPSRAETVSQKEAMKIAQTFFNTLYEEVTAPPKLVWNGRQLTTDRLFNPFYIYNSPKGGFVIISAENKAYPVLGYSRENVFSREKLGEDETELLKQYAREIELIRYDSRIPTSSLDAWQNMSAYLDRVVRNPYNSSEYNNLSDERKEKIESIDRRNGWIVMPTAVEFVLFNPDDYRELTLEDLLEEESEQEEIPFKFYEDFLETMRKEQVASEMALEEMLSPTKPVIKSLGGGHFEITFPESVKMMRVYGMNGALGTERYFRDTPVVNVDISALVPGFYAGLVLSDSGKIYSFKLYR